MSTLVNEKIRTAVIFEQGKLKPILFSWRNRTYKILQVNFSYSKQVGRETVLYFSVKTKGGGFELSFNREKFSWEIVQIL